MSRLARNARVAVILLLLLVGLIWSLDSLQDRSDVSSDESEAIAELFRDERSGVMVESSGIVQRILDDDMEGSKHQRFILRLESGQTLLISHNIDLAPRVPIEVGDTVQFEGQYEWNDRGGVVHWTHHDPAGQRAGGWLRHGGRLYR